MKIYVVMMHTDYEGYSAPERGYHSYDAAEEAAEEADKILRESPYNSTSRYDVIEIDVEV